MSRAAPIVHKTNLKIGIEGTRDFSPEKRQVKKENEISILLLSQ